MELRLGELELRERSEDRSSSVGAKQPKRDAMRLTSSDGLLALAGLTEVSVVVVGFLAPSLAGLIVVRLVVGRLGIVPSWEANKKETGRCRSVHRD